jgi:hypothetical protein
MRITINAFLACAALALGGCSDDAVEDFDEAGDCEEICDMYQECFDSNYDTDACYDNCTERADDMSNRDQEDMCADCIDNNESCGDATFACTDDCIGIVP